MRHAPEEGLAIGDEVAETARGQEEEGNDTEDVEEPGVGFVFVFDSAFGSFLFLAAISGFGVGRKAGADDLFDIGVFGS